MTFSEHIYHIFVCDVIGVLHHVQQFFCTVLKPHTIPDLMCFIVREMFHQIEISSH